VNNSSLTPSGPQAIDYINWAVLAKSMIVSPCLMMKSFPFLRISWYLAWFPLTLVDTVLAEMMN